MNAVICDEIPKDLTFVEKYAVKNAVAAVSTKEILEYKTGKENAYKVDGSNPKQIAESIKRIIHNKEEAINKRVQALRDVQQFGWPIIAQKFLDYLKEDEIKNDNGK